MLTPGGTVARGYGHTHRTQRNKWAPLVAAGGVVCTRYGHPQFPDCPGYIHPDEPWDLGHDDYDRSIWTGPEHMSCNRRAAPLKQQGVLDEPVLRSSRDW